MSLYLNDENLKQIISKKLEMLRRQSGLTMERTAHDLEMDTSEYFRILKGQRVPLLRSMIRFSRKYAVSLDWWFEDIKLPQKQNEPVKDPLEYQVFKILKGLDTKGRKITLDTLKALTKNLKK
jgi:transcriptional regulator with XRE-family HTH domain